MTPAKTTVSRRGFLKNAAGWGLALLGAPAVGTRVATAEAEKPQSEPWRIGCFTRPWAQHDYTVALDAIAEAGFRYAGLLTAKGGNVISTKTTPARAEEIRLAVEKRKLGILATYGGAIAVKESVAAGVADMRRLIDRCAHVGSATLLMGGIAEEKLYKPYYKAIAETADYAKEAGVGITLKPHGGLNATGPACRKALEQVDHDNVTLWYDPGNIFYYSDGKLDPTADAATVDGLVTGMCVKDYKHPKDVDVMPGDGQVDFPRVMARLRKGGFTQGSLVIETLAKGELPSLLAQAKKTRRFLERLVREPAHRNSISK
jgi:sugar phosphate isomerase/epimerase